MDFNKRGQAPFGFRWEGGQLLVVSSEVAIRKLAVELVLKLKSMGAVARALNAEGRETRRGGQWSDVQVARILSCPSAIGRYEIKRSEKPETGLRVRTPGHEREIVECEPLVSREVWDRVQKVLSDRAKENRTKLDEPIFAGMLWCGCGSRMKIVADTGKFACLTCGNKVPSADIEAVFLEDFFGLASTVPILAAAMGAPSDKRQARAELAGLNAALVDARSKREGVERMFNERAIQKRRFDELHGPAEKQVRDVEGRIKKLNDQLGDDGGTLLPDIGPAEWKRRWSAWPASRRRQIVSAFVDRITVSDGEIEITYLLLDSSSKDAPQVQQITRPTNQPQTTNGPVYVRLPKPGEKCPITGLSRAKLNELILPNERNNFDPPVASKSLRQKGAQRGIRLVLLESLMAYLSGSS